MRPEPAVTVVMTAYNAERFLREAIDSVLAQQFEDWELLVIDDGSTDGTAAILNSYTDPRIVRIVNEENLGQPKTRNRGLLAARGRFVAILDADDEAEPDRLGTQVAFLEARPGATMACSWVTTIDEHGRAFGEHRTPPDPVVLGWDLAVRNGIRHPSTMMRKAPILNLGGYDERYIVSQDYDLWTRILMAGGTILTMPNCLTRYRLSAGHLSRTRAEEQRRNCVEISSRYLNWVLGEPVSASLVDRLWRFKNGDPGGIEPRALQEVVGLMIRLTEACTRKFGPGSARRVEEHAADFLFDVAGRYEAEQPRVVARLARAMVRAGLVNWTDPRAWDSYSRFLPPRLDRSWRWGKLRPFRRASERLRLRLESPSSRGKSCSRLGPSPSVLEVPANPFAVENEASN